jgi:hypothetical protein
MLSQKDSTVLKQALAGAAAVPGAKTWHVVTQPNPQAATDFVNLDPAQGAGEVSITNRPDGTVDVYYFL